MENKISKSWTEVSTYQYLELINSFENDSIIEKYIQFLCILSDTEIEYWYKKDIEEIFNLVKELVFLEKEPESILNKELENFNLIDINKIKLGEFIDIEYYLNNGGISNLHKIATIMYKKFKHDEFGNVILEQYDNINFEKRAEFFLNQPITNIIGIVKYINEFKNTFNNNFKSILEPEINEEDLDPEEELTIEDKKAIEKEKLMKAWTWEFLLNNLTHGDITKYNEVLNLPLIFVFNQLTFKKTFNIE
jgi:hypothetical protein